MLGAADQQSVVLHSQEGVDQHLQNTVGSVAVQGEEAAGGNREGARDDLVGVENTHTHMGDNLQKSIIKFNYYVL